MEAIHPILRKTIKEWLSQADGLLITAGAGMGVDSGLPTYRGDTGLWNHYPALEQNMLTLRNISCPNSFFSDPELAWGFYGHRLMLYRETIPHAGFQMLLDMAASMENGAFVFTSNVDGQFQKAGYSDSRIVECHGSIHYMQCMSNCDLSIWPAATFVPVLDEKACKLCSPYPRCPACGGLARPNILMFDDFNWISDRTDRQYMRYRAWLDKVKAPVVIELGAGTDIPIVRRTGGSVTPRLIRINPAQDHGNCIHIQAGAIEGLNIVNACL